MSVSLIEVSTAVRESASVQCRVVRISHEMKPLSSMNELSSSTTKGSAPKMTKNVTMPTNGTQRQAPRSSGRAW